MKIWPFNNRSNERAGMVRSYWDAAGAGNRLATWSAPSSNFASALTAPMVKDRARDAYRNNPWARRAVDLLSTDAIGVGIKPQLRTDDIGRKRAFERAWNEWVEVADFSGRFDLYGFQKNAFRAVVVDGECIVRMVPSPGQRVPLQLQLLGSEFMDDSRVNLSATGPASLNGIKYDESGRRVAFHLFRKHPALAPTMVSVEVPADQVAHLFSPEQPGVERGVSRLAPALVALRELQEYIEAQLVRSKVAALYCGFIRTNDGSTPLNQQPDGTVPFEPGTMARLKAGEEIDFSAPPDVGVSFDPFIRTQLRAIASALDVPYEYLSGDYSGVTFASGRHAILSYARQLSGVQDFIMVHQLLTPVLRMWTRLAVASGALPGNPEDYANIRWIAPRLEMLDPKSETRAQVERVRAGLKSRSETIAQEGWDAEDIDAEIAADNSRADRLGLVFDSDPRKTTLQGQEQGLEQPGAAPSAAV